MPINAVLLVVALALVAAGPAFAYQSWGWSFALSAVGLVVLGVAGVRIARGRGRAGESAAARHPFG